MGFTTWIILGLIVAMLVVMLLNGSRQKKQEAEMQKTLSELKPGDKVKTYIGVYGKILSITETTDGKVCVIETGDKNKSQIELDMRAIAGRDAKQIAVYDENNNLISLDSKPVDLAAQAESANNTKKAKKQAKNAKESVPATSENEALEQKPAEQTPAQQKPAQSATKKTSAKRKSSANSTKKSAKKQVK